MKEKKTIVKERKINVGSKINENYYPDFRVDSISRTWNSQALRTLVDPHDVKIIESIPLGRTQMVDRDE